MANKQGSKMLGSYGSALDAAKPLSERIVDAQWRVFKAEEAIKKWQNELEAARKALKIIDVFPRPQGAQ